MISDVQVVLSVDSILPLTRCKSPSCRSCQQLSVVPHSSFPTIHTSELVCISACIFVRFDSGSGAASDVQHSLVGLVPFGH